MQQLRYLFQTTSVLFPIPRRNWFVWKGHSGELVFIVGIANVLDIFENRIQVLHSVDVQKADFRDEKLQMSTLLQHLSEQTYCHTPRSESATRKADKYNLITRLIISSDETISLSDVLAQFVRSTVFTLSKSTHLGNSRAKGSPDNHVRDIPFRPNTRLVISDLNLPIVVPPAQRPIDTSHIRGDLQSVIWLLEGRSIVTLITVDPGTIQT